MRLPRPKKDEGAGFQDQRLHVVSREEGAILLGVVGAMRREGGDGVMVSQFRPQQEKLNVGVASVAFVRQTGCRGWSVFLNQKKKPVSREIVTPRGSIGIELREVIQCDLDEGLG